MQEMRVVLDALEMEMAKVKTVRDNVNKLSVFLNCFIKVRDEMAVEWRVRVEAAGRN